MYCVARRPDEGVTMVTPTGEKITVGAKYERDGRILICIQAPKTVQIDRQETAPPLQTRSAKSIGEFLRVRKAVAVA